LRLRSQTDLAAGVLGQIPSIREQIAEYFYAPHEAALHDFIEKQLIGAEGLNRAVCEKLKRSSVVHHYADQCWKIICHVCLQSVIQIIIRMRTMQLSDKQRHDA